MLEPDVQLLLRATNAYAVRLKRAFQRGPQREADVPVIPVIVPMQSSSLHG